MIRCLICLQDFKNNKSLATHLNLTHKLKSKEYYDKYIKEENEGVCLNCKKETTYRNFGVGYLKTCCKNCDTEYKKISGGFSKFWLGKTQPKEMVSKRIENTNQKKKEKTRKKTFKQKYGVSNYGQTLEGRKKTSDRFKGKTITRSKSHQNKIIEAKRKNGTLNHSEETKKKISDSNSGENNAFRKYLSGGGKIPKNSGGISGYYGDLYFRSSLELSFIYLYKKIGYTIISAENNNYKINYYDKGFERVYYPDFFILELDLVVELKPYNLLTYNNNALKIESAKKTFKNFKVFTEKEIPYLKKEIIDFLIKEGTIMIDEKSKKKLERYKH